MAPQAPPLPNANRAVWLKNLHRWHWISAALSLMGMLAFAITGITLNHATQIEAKPVVTKRSAAMPAPMAAKFLTVAEAADDSDQPLPADVADWVEGSLDIKVAGLAAEWSDGEAYIPLPRPGGDAWVRIDAEGKAEFEKTDRGWISWLNDLHKGRNTGATWSWFIDIFAGACIIFSLTGFMIMKLHAANRPSTWPVIGFGILAPVLLALLFTH